MQEFKQKLDEINEHIGKALKTIDLEGLSAQLDDLNKQMQAEDFWSNQEKAQSVSQQASNIQKTIEMWEDIRRDIEELEGLYPTISVEENPQEAAEFKEMCEDFFKKWRKLEISTFLNGKYDKNHAILSIHAGTGGTDAQDWAGMLLRMYLRYCEKTDFEARILDKSEGEEAGIKSVTIEVKGIFAYGYLKGEGGVHRLVRLSPFNSKNTRETSFALVEVLPEIHEEQKVEIKDEDLRVDTFRASGHGGQSVNTTDSAVRITHEPTGIVVSCQNERSQLQNKEQCMKILHAKLADLMEKEQAEKLEQLRGGKTEMSWGNQIRSYVLHPYKMVKDHRTDYEENQAEAVLDGNLEGFIEAELKK